MKVRIDIDTRTFVRFWLVVIGFALAILAIHSSLAALTILGAAFFLALALNPPVNLISRRLPGKSRAGATALAYVAVLAVLAIIIFLVIPPIVGQTQKFAQNVPNLIDSASKQYKGLNSLIDQYHVRSQVNQVAASIKSSASTFASGIGTTLVSGIGSVVSTVTSTILILVLAFFMLIEGPQWLRSLWKLYADKERMKHHRLLLTKMYNVVTGYVIGQLSVSAIDGLTAGLGVVVLSFFFPDVPINLAIPIAAIVFVLSLIPLFGAVIGGLVGTGILLLNSLPAAIIFILFFVVYQQIESNFIAPKIQSKRLDLSALLILSAVTIGVYLFGIAGGIISIPIAGCLKVLMDDYIARREVVKDDHNDEIEIDTKTVKAIKEEGVKI